MLCFGRVCASCALNVRAALQGAYITPFPTEVIRAIHAQRDKTHVLKIVCYLHVMASNPHPPLWRAPHLDHFYFTSPQAIRPKEASDSDFTIEDVMLWPGMRFSLRSQCKRCSAGRLHNSLPYGSRSAIRDQRDEAYVSKIVCYLHVMASNPHPPLWRAPHLHHFYFTSSQPIRPKEASDSDFTIEDVMLWPGMRFSSERCSAGRLQSPSCPLQLSIFSI